MFLNILRSSFIRNYDLLFVCKFRKMYIYCCFHKYWFFFYNFLLLSEEFIGYFNKLVLGFGFFYFLNYNLYNRFSLFFFVEIFVDGLYYRVKHYKKYNLLGFILGYNHYVLYKIPRNFQVAVHMKRRRFFVYGFNYKRLVTLAYDIINLKYPNLFKGKGLRIVGLKYRKKLIIKKTK